MESNNGISRFETLLASANDEQDTSTIQKRRRMTRQERKDKKNAEAKALATQRAKALRQRVEREKQVEERQNQKLAVARKRQATTRATSVFMHDPSMDAVLKEIKHTCSPVSNVKEESNVEHKTDDDQEDNLGRQNTDDLQQLRGIFAAHDDNRDGLISDEQLRDALVSLGFLPTDDLVEMYRPRSAKFSSRNDQQDGNVPNSYKMRHRERRGSNRGSRLHFKIDMADFLSGASNLDSAQDCIEDILPAFEALDTKGSGKVSQKQLIHLLQGISAPTRLSKREVEEFFHNCDKIDTTSKSSQWIAYEDLLESMIFV